MLRVGETVVAAKASYRLTLARNERQTRECANQIANVFEFAVDSVFAERRLKGKRIEEEVDVFRETLNQIPAF